MTTAKPLSRVAQVTSGTVIVEKKSFCGRRVAEGNILPTYPPNLSSGILLYFISYFFFLASPTQRGSSCEVHLLQEPTSLIPWLLPLFTILWQRGERERERKKRGTSSIRPIKFYGTFERCIGLCPPGSWSWLSYLSPLSFHYFRPNLIPLRAFPAPHLPYLFTSVWMEHIL